MTGTIWISRGVATGVAITVVALVSSVTFAGQAVEGAGCFECHDAGRIRGAAFVHGPVALDACAMCHQPHPRDDHSSQLTRAGAALCIQCHDAADYRGKYVHAPVRRGCVGCHAPHGGATYSLLETSTGGLCARCHARQRQRRATARARCTRCHEVHRARRADLLRTNAPRGRCARDRRAPRATRVTAR